MVKIVRFSFAGRNNLIEISERIWERTRLACIGWRLASRNKVIIKRSPRRVAATGTRVACAPRILHLHKAQSNRSGFPWWDLKPIMRRCLGPDLVRVYKVKVLAEDGIVNRILHKSAGIWDSPKPGEIGFVFGEETLLRLFTMKMVSAECAVGGFDQRWRSFLQVGFAIVATPAPGVAKPNRRQQMKRRRFRPAVRCGDPDQDVVRGRFGVFDLDIKKPIFAEHIGIPEFEFALHPCAVGVLPYQFIVRE